MLWTAPAAPNAPQMQQDQAQVLLKQKVRLLNKLDTKKKSYSYISF
jgi:hypothetical protein